MLIPCAMATWRISRSSFLSTYLSSYARSLISSTNRFLTSSMAIVPHSRVGCGSAQFDRSHRGLSATFQAADIGRHTLNCSPELGFHLANSSPIIRGCFLGSNDNPGKFPATFPPVPEDRNAIANQSRTRVDLLRSKAFAGCPGRTDPSPVDQPVQLHRSIHSRSSLTAN